MGGLSVLCVHPHNVRPYGLPWFCCFVMFIAYCTMGELPFAPTWLPTMFLLFCVIHCKSHVATWTNCDMGELLFAPTIF